MTISQLIDLLQRSQDEYGDVPVELLGGNEAYALAAVYETGSKDPKVVAVCVK